jgi:uncharacterized RDD family membrane protein YckC
MATFVDIFVFLAVVVFTFVVVLPFFMPEAGYGYENELGMVWAALVLACIAALVFLLQLPFMLTQQTIGKALMRLRIVSTNLGRPVTVGIVFQRELFAKACTCYFMCVPVLFGKEGQHDIACETEVV